MIKPVALSTGATHQASTRRVLATEELIGRAWCGVAGEPGKHCLHGPHARQSCSVLGGLEERERRRLVLFGEHVEAAHQPRGLPRRVDSHLVEIELRDEAMPLELCGPLQEVR